MRRAILVLGLVLTLGLTIPPTASAFDGYRRGFVLGGGLGPGILSAKQELSGFGVTAESDWQSEFALVTDFHIGAGLNDKLVLYYSSRVNWFWPSDASLTLANGIGTIALNVYAEPTSPSFYFTAGLGLSSLDAPFEENADASYGPGMRVGVGMEVNPHWSLEFALTYGKADEDIAGVSLDTDMVTAQFVVVGMAY